MVRLEGLRNGVEQGDKQGKGELGWAAFQVRSEPGAPAALGAGVLWVLVLLAGRPRRAACSTRPAHCPGRSGGHAGAQATGHRGGTGRARLVAGGAASGAGLADPLQRAGGLLTVVVTRAPAPAAATAA